MTTARALNLLVGRALVSERYCADLLNGRRADLIRSVGLEPQAAEQVLAIRARTLTEFAQTLDQMLRRQGAAY
jgi:hypothetical protein